MEMILPTNGKGGVSVFVDWRGRPVSCIGCGFGGTLSRALAMRECMTSSWVSKNTSMVCK